MDETTPQKDLTQAALIRYLLGDLPEAEADALEVRLLTDQGTDDQMNDAVQEAEYKLIDLYARNQLSPAQRALFESHYLASPLHRERAATALHLTRAADAQPLTMAETAPVRLVPQPAAAGVVWWRTLFAAPAFAWSTALALVVLGGLVIWLLLERGRLLNQLQAQQQSTQNLETELAQQRSTLEQVLAQRAITPTPLPAVTATPNLPAAKQVFALMLVPQLRGTSTTTTVTLTPTIKTIRLQAKIEPGEATQYQAELRTANSVSLLRQRLNVTAQATSIELNVPATKLANNEYVLILSTVNATKELEEVNRYAFRVILFTRP